METPEWTRGLVTGGQSGRSWLAAAVFLFLLCSGRTSVSQEMNYSSLSPGGRPALMGGTGVGGVRDTSAVHYNPARLAFVDNSSISVSGNVFRAGGVRVDDILGPGRDLDQSIFDIVPVLVSGMHRFEDLPDWSFGFGINTRQQYSVDFRGVERSMLNAIADDISPGTEDFAGQYESSVDANEVAGIFGVAWSPLKNFAIGISPTVSFRSQASRSRLAGTAGSLVNGEFLTARSEFTSDTSFYQFSLSVPVSATWNPLENLSLGIQVRPPASELFGSGSVLSDALISTYFANEGEVVPLVLGASDAQDGLETNYRTPFSVELGAEWAVTQDWSVAFATSWTDGLSRESVVGVRSGQPFVIGFPGAEDSTAQLRTFDARRDVARFALGVERRFGPKWAGYVGFTTDFSPTDVDDIQRIGQGANGSPLSFNSVDLYHVTIGASYRRTRSLTSVGVGLSFGNGATVAPNADFVANPGALDPDGILVGAGAGMRRRDLSFFAVSVILSYTYFF